MTDAGSVRELVKGADVVVHLAFAIVSAGDATRDLNIAGSRRVFEEACKAGAERICYASSVAAYGFHDDNPDWLTEEIPARGSPEHPYSQQKAEVEQVLGEVLLRHSGTVAYAFRPCIVAGPEALMMLQELPYFRLSEAMPDAVARLLALLPILKPVIPDPGAPFQLVHAEDVARAFVAGVRGVGEPGPYNLAGDGTLGMSDLADALGWYSVPIPKLAVEATAEIATRLPLVPDSVAWLHSVRKPVSDEDRPCAQAAQVAPPAHGPRHARRNRHGLSRKPLLQRPPVELRVVVLAHLARVEKRGAVSERALHQRRDAGLRDAHLGQARGQAEPAAELGQVGRERVADL